MFLRLVFCFGVALMLVGAAAADVPQLVNYQGILLDADGEPVTAPSTVIFAIWNDPTAGVSLWSEEQVITPDSDGRFNVLLGLVTPIPGSAFVGTERYLSMQLDTYPEMLPRTRIVTVAYAYRISTVDGAAGGVISGDISITAGDLNLDQSSAGSGNIFKGGNPFIHNFGSENTFVGSNAGNFTMTGRWNTACGYHALGNNSAGNYNTACGYEALFDNIDGNHNAASGNGAMSSNTTGSFNTACGAGALHSNTTGSFNTASGFRALHNNTAGDSNSAIGADALNNNTTGHSNTASGIYALFRNTTGNFNTANGKDALYSNTSGGTNTASGWRALYSNTTGNYNTACGYGALYGNTTGGHNTASGYQTLYSNTTGHSNAASGWKALYSNTTGYANTASGRSALFSNTTGYRNTGIGAYADLASGNLTNATAIGFGAIVNASNKIRLGNSDVTVIEGQVPFTWPSDKNDKENFRPVDGDEVLRKIREFELTSWNYIGHDPQKFRHYGPVAQEFFAAFGQDDVGTIGTPTTINSGDIAGILMIAVQALEKRTAEVAELRDQIEELRQVVNQLSGDNE